LAAGDKDLANRLGQRFLVNARKSYGDMVAKGREGDLTALGNLGHRLKSSSAQVGAKEMSELCAALETLGHQVTERGSATDEEHTTAASLLERIGPLLTALEAHFASP
jgi:HPt (histidine-containing phosphotransfer) domain-containing protein